MTEKSLLKQLQAILELAEKVKKKYPEDSEYIQGYALGVSKAVEEFERLLSEAAARIEKESFRENGGGYRSLVSMSVIWELFAGLTEKKEDKKT